MPAGSPNILLIYTDQQRHDTLSALGHRWSTTPHLDRLAETGTAFTQCTTASPVCMPARWSLHSGQYPSTHRCYSNHHPGVRPETDLVTELRDAGYATALVGKNHSFLTEDDFDFFEPGPTPTSEAWPARRAWSKQPGNARLALEPAPGGSSADPDHAKTDAAVKFIKNCHDQAQPWFMWLSYLAPHTPYQVPDPWFSQFANAPVPPPAVEPDGSEKPFRQRFHQANNDAIIPFDDATALAMRRVYAAMVAFVDHQIGRVIEQLDQQGELDETLVIFTSDHGDYMGDHRLFTKSPAMYDCLIRVPLIMRFGNRGCELDRRPVSQIDLMPTILDGIQRPIPSQCQGHSVTRKTDRSFTYGEYGLPGKRYTEQRARDQGITPGDFANPNNPAIAWEGNPVALAGPISMLRSDRWKYVCDGGIEDELYDLADDPNELINRIDDPACGKALLRIREQHAAFQRSIGAESHCC